MSGRAGAEAVSTERKMRRIALTLGAIIFLVPLSIAGFFIAVDPYYVFGSPNIPGLNRVRPYYEPYGIVVKPYQVSRIRPSAVVLGSSTAEIGLDPQHPGWATPDAFNFAMPSSNSYAVMLAFLHAQKVGAPLKQVVVNLDFFAYNINYPLNHNTSERRLARGIAAEFAKYLDDILTERRKPPATAERSVNAEPGWNEALYLAVNPDVAAAIARKEFKSGREHWDLAGRAERRLGAMIPDNWDEAGYLRVHADVAAAVSRGTFVNGYHHYLAAGRVEGRLGGFQPKDWNEAGYFSVNPEARIWVALGYHQTGFQHYAAVGHRLGLLGGLPPANPLQKLKVRWPGFDRALFHLAEYLDLAISTRAMHDAILTPFRQSEPADFNDSGLRVWQGREPVVQKLGGVGNAFRKRLAAGGVPLWFVPPNLQFCFGNTETGMTMFEPYRFMLRRAYAEGVDVRLVTTPIHAAFFQMFEAVGLRERYEFWLKEVVRINEEEAARASRPPMPLWDFGYANTITREPIPAADDLTPMQSYWDQMHYRKYAGDLMLDRVFDYKDPNRTVPADFGVRLTSKNVDEHIVRGRVALADWAAANPDLVALAQNPEAKRRQAEATCW